MGKDVCNGRDLFIVVDATTLITKTIAGGGFHDKFHRILCSFLLVITRNYCMNVSSVLHT